jgi:acetyl-CoA acetyltransferase
VYRHSEVSLGSLAVVACRTAIADAGMTPADIDGVATDPYQPYGLSDQYEPFDGVGVIDGYNTVRPELLINALGLDVCWHEAVGQSNIVAGSTGRMLVEAVNAVSSGMCRSVIVCRAMHSPPGQYGALHRAYFGGPMQFIGPYGVDPPAMYAHLWSRYMHKYGTTREQMAPFVVNNWSNGLLWEHGYWHQQGAAALTENDYLTARMISTPLALYDCDLPVQGCGAFVVTSAERAVDLPHRPAYVRGWAVPGRLKGFDPAVLEVVRERGEVFAKHLFANAGIGPDEIDVLNVYDGFSIFVPLWLETLGYCGEGEAFDLMTSDRIGIHGDLPVNTNGGNLGAGRMHGVPHFMESVLQIMGRCGARQVPDAMFTLATAGGQPGRCAGMIFGASPD